MNGYENSDILEEFLKLVQDDLDSPCTSTFVHHAESLSKELTFVAMRKPILDSACVMSFRSTAEVMHNEMLQFAAACKSMAESLTTNGTSLANTRDSPMNNETDLTEMARFILGSVMIKLAIVVKDASSVIYACARDTHSNLVFPLQELVANDKLTLADTSKEVEKSYDRYNKKLEKCIKDLNKRAKDNKYSKRPSFSPSEVHQETFAERRSFQLSIVNMLLCSQQHAQRLSIDVASNLLQFYNHMKQESQEMLRILEGIGGNLAPIVTQIDTIRARGTTTRGRLQQLKGAIEQQLNTSSDISFMLPAPVEFTEKNRPNSCYSLSDGSALSSKGETGAEEPMSISIRATQMTDDGDFVGYLYKKRTGNKFARVRRKIELSKEGYLRIYHADENSPSIHINLLTAKVTPCVDEKRCFEIRTTERTFNLQAESSLECNKWISALHKAIDRINQQTFEAETPKGSVTSSRYSFDSIDVRRQKPDSNSARYSIVKRILAIAGNEQCCDCQAPIEKKNAWASTNLGILLCLPCSGVHRSLGVHISRVHSLSLDDLSSAQLLLTLAMGNRRLNRVYEALLANSKKLRPSCTQMERQEYIKSKYMLKLFATKKSHKYAAPDIDQLLQSKRLEDLLTLIVTDSINSNTTVKGDNTVLTWLITHDQEGDTLPALELLLANGFDPNQATRDYACRTPLHMTIELPHRVEHAKLLLRHHDVDLSLKDIQEKMTPLELAQSKNRNDIERLILMFEKGSERAVFENVLIPLKLLNQSNGSTQSSPSFVPKPTANIKQIQKTLASEVEERIKAKPPLLHAKPRKQAPAVPTKSDSINTSLDEQTINRHSSGNKVVPSLVEPAKCHSMRRSDRSDSIKLSCEMTPNSSVSMHGNDLGSPMPMTTTPMPINRLQKYENVIVATTQVAESPSNSGPPLPPRTRRHIAVALYDCAADDKDELSFKRNDRIVITRMLVDTESDEWMEGHLESKPNCIGLIPKSFVKLL